MSTVGPVIAALIAQNAAAQGSSATGTVADGARALQGQPQGATIQGTVVGQNAAGTALAVRTALGVITVNTSTYVPPSSSVQLQIVTPGNRPVVALVLAASGANAQAGAQAAGAGAGVAAAGGQAAPVTLPGGQVANFINAVFNGPVSGGQNVPGAGTAGGGIPGAAVPGGGVPGAGVPGAGGQGTGLPIPGGGTPFVPPGGGQAGAGATGSATGGAVLTGTPGAVASGGAGGAVSLGGLTLTPGAPLAARIVALQPPGAGAASVVSQASGGFSTVAGIVSGTTSQGLPFVDTAAGRITLQTRADLPVGTRLTLEVAARGVDPGVPPNAAARALTALSSTWNGLGEALQALAAGDPGAARVLTSGLPQPNAGLGNGMLFVLSALRGGDLRNLIPGDTRDALNRIGRGDIMRGLGEKMGQIRGMSGDQIAPSDWRAFPIPLYNESKLEQLMLYVRKYHGKGGEDGEAVEGTRFVVDFDLSKMGQVQLDGLVREKRFDLMVRSIDGVPVDVRNHVTSLFQEANEITGFKGSISFQKVTKFPVAPMDEIADRLDVKETGPNAPSDHVTI